MPPRMTSVAWQRGFKNAMICGIGLFGVIGILTFGISTLTGRPFQDLGTIVITICWAATFVVFVLTFLIGRGKRGAILLDCGHHPARIFFLFNAVAFAFLGLGSDFSANALFGTLSVYWVLMSFGRLQIAENGIWQYWSLLKWQKLESYEWRGDANATLMLQSKMKLPFLGRGALPVSAEHKEAISELLKKYAAQKNITSSVGQLVPDIDCW